MRIGEIADAAGVTTKTIRFWEAQGLVPTPDRTASGYRVYEPVAVERLAFIRRAQGAGFRLDEIRQVLEISDEGASPCQHVSTLIAQHIAAVDERIAELTETRRELTRLARRAKAQDPADCHDYCDILTAI